MHRAILSSSTLITDTYMHSHHAPSHPGLTNKRLCLVHPRAGAVFRVPEAAALHANLLGVGQHTLQEGQVRHKTMQRVCIYVTAASKTSCCFFLVLSSTTMNELEYVFPDLLHARPAGSHGGCGMHTCMRAHWGVDMSLLAAAVSASYLVVLVQPCEIEDGRGCSYL